MKIKKTENDLIYMDWSKLSALMISLGWIDDNIKCFTATQQDWADIGLKYIKSTFINRFHFEVVDKSKFAFSILKHCVDFDGIHYHG
jgi:hypothetical protein